MHNIRAWNKRTLGVDVESTPKAKRGRPKVSQVLTRYPPVKDTGDDEVTVKRNSLLLAKELDKEKPRKEVVLTLARQTYSTRRANILSESEDITASKSIMS